MLRDVDSNFKSHYWCSKYQNTSQLIKDSFIQIDQKVSKKMDKITHTPQVNNYPHKEVLHIRELLETKEFDDDFRQKVERAHKKKGEFVKKNQTSFGEIDKCHLQFIEEVIYKFNSQNKNIQRRILEERLKEEREKLDQSINMS